jgi:hypothetical protein
MTYGMPSTNTLSCNYSNRLYLVCPIGGEIINKVLSHSIGLVLGVTLPGSSAHPSPSGMIAWFTTRTFMKIGDGGRRPPFTISFFLYLNFPLCRCLSARAAPLLVVGVDGRSTTGLETRRRSTVMAGEDEKDEKRRKNIIGIWRPEVGGAGGVGRRRVVVGGKERGGGGADV